MREVEEYTIQYIGAASQMKAVSIKDCAVSIGDFKEKRWWDGWKNIDRSSIDSRIFNGYQSDIHNYYSKAIMDATAAIAATIREATERTVCNKYNQHRINFNRK